MKRPEWAKGAVFSAKDVKTGIVKVETIKESWLTKQQAEKLASNYAKRGYRVAVLPTYKVGNLYGVGMVSKKD